MTQFFIYIFSATVLMVASGIAQIDRRSLDEKYEFLVLNYSLHHQAGGSDMNNEIDYKNVCEPDVYSTLTRASAEEKDAADCSDTQLSKL